MKVLIILFWFWNCWADTSVQLDAVKNLLASQSVVRVGVLRGRGNGHQSAAATIVTRLRELGYSGYIEVIYENQEAGKLEYLFPPFRLDGGPVQAYPDRKLRFISRREFLNQPNKIAVDLGFIGATQDFVSPELLNVRYLLAVHPLNWSRDGYIHMPYGQRRLPHTSTLGYVFDVSRIENTAALLHSEMSHTSKLRSKIAGLNAIFNQPSNFHEIGVVYGHQVTEGWQVINYVRGLFWAMRHYPSLFVHGSVVPVLNSLDVVQRSGLSARLRQLRENGFAVDFYNVRDPRLPQAIAHVQPGQVLVVDVGPAAKKVFEQLYIHGTLVPVVEGQNSINLLQLLGRPYLPSLYRETYHFMQWDLEFSEPGDHLLTAAAIANWSWHRPNQEEAAARLIGEVIVQARDPHSQVSSLFRRQRESLDVMADDQLLRGLNAMVHVQEEVSQGTFLSDESELAGSSLYERMRYWFVCHGLLSSRR